MARDKKGKFVSERSKTRILKALEARKQAAETATKLACLPHVEADHSYESSHATAVETGSNELSSVNARSSQQLLGESTATAAASTAYSSQSKPDISHVTRLEYVVDEDYCEMDDLEYCGNVDWRGTRCVVDLGNLAQHLFCKNCQLPLSLNSCQGFEAEGVSGYLYVRCDNSACEYLTRVPAAKQHFPKGRKKGVQTLDVNTKVVLGKFFLFSMSLIEISSDSNNNYLFSL